MSWLGSVLKYVKRSIENAWTLFDMLRVKGTWRKFRVINQKNSFYQISPPISAGLYLRWNCLYNIFQITMISYIFEKFWFVSFPLSLWRFDKNFLVYYCSSLISKAIHTHLLIVLSICITDVGIGIYQRNIYGWYHYIKEFWQFS